MITKRIASIFRRGSRTYFYSSIFFPAAVRADVFKLYAFVRVADDFVDRTPQDREGLEAFVSRYRSAMAGAPAGDDVIDGYVELAQRRGFEPDWTESFLEAMRQDLVTGEYDSIADVEKYMYGSAEVIGLQMARILALPDEAHPSARRLGTAMQYVNFLRDIEEDRNLGRVYVPRDVRERHGLTGLSRAEAEARPEGFRALMRAEIERYGRWQSEAERGYAYLRPRYRVPIQTAADMYKWTAQEIERDPVRVFEGRIKPSVARILLRLARNTIAAAAAASLEAWPVRRLQEVGAGVLGSVR